MLLIAVGAFTGARPAARPWLLGVVLVGAAAIALTILRTRGTGPAAAAAPSTRRAPAKRAAKAEPEKCGYCGAIKPPGATTCPYCARVL